MVLEFMPAPKDPGSKPWHWASPCGLKFQACPGTQLMFEALGSRDSWEPKLQKVSHEPSFQVGSHGPRLWPSPGPGPPLQPWAPGQLP